MMKIDTKILFLAAAAMAAPLTAEAGPRFSLPAGLQSRFNQSANSKGSSRDINQTQTSNNQSPVASDRFGSGTIRPTGGTADLAVTSITHRGDTVDVTVKNVGTRGAPMTELRVSVTRLSDNRRLVTQTIRIRNLLPQDSQVYQFQSMPMDEVKVIAFVDPNSRVKELSEQNNTRLTIFQRQNAVWPDYAIQRIFPRPNGVRVDLVNFGTVNAPETVCLVTVRRNSDNATIRRVAVPVAAMAARGETSIFVAAAEVSGTTVTVSVDPNRVVSEMKESNNTLQIPF